MKTSGFQLTSVALSIFALSSATHAQTMQSFAPSYALAQINSNNVYPYVSSTIRYQQIHDSWTFSETRPIIIRALRYRPSLQNWYYNRSGGTVDVMIQLALTPTGVKSTNASKTFANNIDAKTLKTVFKRKKISYPSSGANLAELKVFDIKFPFDTGAIFVYQQNLARSLLVETRQYGRVGGSYGFDFVSSTSVTGNGFVAPNGSYLGCKSKSGKLVTYSADGSTLKLGAQAQFRSNGQAKSIPAVMTMGTQALNVTLPGTNCKIVNDLMFLTAGATDAAGAFNISFKIPNNQNLYRVSFLTQVVFLEPQANAMGLVTTRGLHVGIGSGTPNNNTGIARIYAFSSTPDKVATAASYFRNGLVTMFHN